MAQTLNKLGGYVLIVIGSFCLMGYVLVLGVVALVVWLVSAQGRVLLILSLLFALGFISGVYWSRAQAMGSLIRLEQEKEARLQAITAEHLAKTIKGEE